MQLKRIGLLFLLGGLATAARADMIAGTNSPSNTLYVSSTTSGTNGKKSLTNAQYVNMAQILLTVGGDYDIAGVCGATLNGATITDDLCALSQNSGNTTTDQVLGDNQVYTFTQTTNIDAAGAIPAWRQSLTAGTTVYLKIRSDFTGGPPLGYGRVSARKVK